jgi:myo-inositol catabolism protein IolC
MKEIKCQNLTKYQSPSLLRASAITLLFPYEKSVLYKSQMEHLLPVTLLKKKHVKCSKLNWRVIKQLFCGKKSKRDPGLIVLLEGNFGRDSFVMNTQEMWWLHLPFNYMPFYWSCLHSKQFNVSLEWKLLKIMKCV